MHLKKPMQPSDVKLSACQVVRVWGTRDSLANLVLTSLAAFLHSRLVHFTSFRQAPGRPTPRRAPEATFPASAAFFDGRKHV